MDPVIISGCAVAMASSMGLVAVWACIRRAIDSV